ncbi:MAG TPA: aminoglycoside phosphotransferase family protein [Candidatus Sulfotelmatobacter sp.]|nr:aminoglycoside phosphotransferase family protein [Candidatus Sulfotelmatobacter sp.]
MTLYDRAALARALAQVPGFAPLTADDLEELDADGIAHAHVRVRGHARLVRVPRFSQVASDARAHLEYQAACFRRAVASGATPRLIGVLAPGDGLPMGGLVVEEILGRVPRLPDDLPALAEALARLHALAVPPPGARPPLLDHADDPLAGARAHLARQAALLDDDDAVAPVLAPASRAILREELAALAPRLDALAGAPQPASLIAFDCHPGNFLIEASGRAVLVDLERVQYGAPASDLAHASLPSSTLWDRRIDVALTRRELARFYRLYRRRLDAAAAARLAPWLAPYRRLIFLRSTTWFVRFLVETRAGRWSAGSLDPAFLAEVARRIGGLLEPARLEAMRAEWRAADPFDPAAAFA